MQECKHIQPHKRWFDGSNRSYQFKLWLKVRDMPSQLSLPRQGPWNFVWVKQVFEFSEFELTEFHCVYLFSKRSSVLVMSEFEPSTRTTLQRKYANPNGLLSAHTGSYYKVSGKLHFVGVHFRWIKLSMAVIQYWTSTVLSTAFCKLEMKFQSISKPSKLKPDFKLSTHKIHMFVCDYSCTSAWSSPSQV